MVQSIVKTWYINNMEVRGSIPKLATYVHSYKGKASRLNKNK
jgi:hypothetical protein